MIANGLHWFKTTRWGQCLKEFCGIKHPWSFRRRGGASMSGATLRKNFSDGLDIHRAQTFSDTNVLL